jgi:acyl carrier protein
MSDNIKTELNSVFCSVFDNPNIQITDDTTSNDIIGWDSFSHINLISAIEIHFNIEFTQSEALGFKTVGELICSIESKTTQS